MARVLLILDSLKLALLSKSDPHLDFGVTAAGELRASVMRGSESSLLLTSFARTSTTPILVVALPRLP